MTKPRTDIRAHSVSAVRSPVRAAAISTTFFAILATALALLAPSSAFAQDPGIDQYAPTPTGGGNEAPVPESGGGSPVATSGADGGSNTSGDATDESGTTVPSGTEPATVAPGASGDEGGSGAEGNKRDRTLAGIAAAAEQQRADRAGAGRTEVTPLSSSSGGESGMGPIVWIVFGLIVLWALTIGVLNFRRRRGDDRPSQKEQTA